jgi:hypothetical protein
MPLLSALPGAPRYSPELPSPLAQDRERLLRAAETIHGLESEIAALRKDRDAATMGLQRLAAHIDSLSAVGAARHFQEMDEALLRERTESVDLRAEIIELRTTLASARAALAATSSGSNGRDVRSSSDSEEPPGSANAPATSHELLVLRSRVVDLEEQLTRQHAVTKRAEDIFNQDHAARLQAAHQAESASLRAQLAQTHSRLADALALLSMHAKLGRVTAATADGSGAVTGRESTSNAVGRARLY